MSRITITIKPTNDCNMRCKHCYHAEEGFKEGFLTIDNAKKMIDIAIKEYDEISIVYHGGEPTLWGLKNYKELFNYQKEISSNRNIKFKNSIQTNGVLFDDDWIELFKKNDVTVGISFDGPHNNDLRSNSSVVLHNMKRIKKSGIKLGILCVETQKSIFDLKNTYLWFKDNNFDFKVLALFMSGNALEHKELELNIEDYVRQLCLVYKYWLYDKTCHFDMRTFSNLLKISDKLFCLKYGGSCIHKRICLNPNGDIYPCGRPYTEDFKLGNVNSLKLISEAFNTPQYHNLYEISKKRQEQCKNHCKYYGICKGGCVSSAILEGSFERIDNETCRRARLLLSSIDKINKEAYAKFDQGIDLEFFNPRALDIMRRSRNGLIDYNQE